jgi:hypothetical protein
MATVTVINCNVTNLQPSYTSLNLGPIPAGTTTDQAAKTVRKALVDLMDTNWPATYPSVPSNQQDSGIMQPWADNVSGTAPACAVAQITTDFKAWSLPFDKNTFSAMAVQITTEIAAQGGDTGTFYGQTNISGSETIYWGVGYTTAVVIDDPETTGIIYSFRAVLGIN